MVAAGAVVPEGARIQPGVLVAGVPASEKKELSGSALAWTENAADEYQKLRERYLLNLTTTRR
jgi:carbonic anhydrase/acetyltransferase-like protein (isoleucine patch superfamily)